MEKIKTYGILKELTPHTLFAAQRDIYNAFGEHIISQFVCKNDKYVLFEKTIRPDDTEYYSNAWSSSDLNYITAKCERFTSYYDYINQNSRDLSGNLSKIT